MFFMPDRIMLVEDEVIVAMDVQQRLKALGYEASAHATGGEEAIQLARETHPDLILMDIKIRGSLDGIETAALIRKTQNIPIIYLTAFADESTLARARLTEAFGYLIKPFEDRELRSAIEIALYKHKIDKKLYESEERYRKVVETSPDGIGITDLKVCFLTVNQKNAEMWGYDTPQEMVNLSLFNLVAQEDRSIAISNFQKVIEGNKTSSFECRFLRKDGSIFWGELNAGCLLDSNGQIVSLITMTRDITDRKMAEETILQLNSELEQRVAIRTAELQVSNKELESFAYSVSHDLRGPLRTMNGFSTLLLEEYSHIIDPQGQDFLKRIHYASINMSTLIDALLNLSRIARAEMIRMDVDLSEIARQISRDLVRTQPDRSVEFIIPEFLIVKSDSALMQILMENLMGNAWKFSSRVDHAQIEVGSTFQNEQAILFVKDNGTGFNMAYADKLFAPFQRLHTGHEFEGTGIGLSIVQRIIHRHGGRVWADSKMGEGATFYFTLGKSRTN
jgi:PAS domain S-box-containing protein